MEMLLQLICSPTTNLPNIVGAFQHVSLTQPDIAFSMNNKYQFMASPLESHWAVVKRILRYLSRAINYGLILSYASMDHKLLLHAYIDSD